MNFSQPPPDVPSMSAPPPPINFSMPPPGIPRSGGMQGSFGTVKSFGNHYFNNHHHHHHNKFSGFMRGPSGMPMSQDDFDGKRLRKSVMRKTVDYNAAIIRELQVPIFFFYIFTY